MTWELDLARRLHLEQLPLRDEIDAILDGTSRAALHLAVFAEPHLANLLAGRRTLESRFSKRPMAPYQQVEPKDILLIKECDGPVVAVARIHAVRCQEIDPASFHTIKEELSDALCADEEFWSARRHANFMTLLTLGDVTPCRPIRVTKKDRRGWVVMRAIDADSLWRVS